MIRLETITQFNTERGQETLHPLVTVLDQSKSGLINTEKYSSSLYLIFLKDVKCESLKYGRNQYDYQDESLLFISPGQVFGFDEKEKRRIQPNGWVLGFHPDFIRGTPLGRHILQYRFFSYDVHEALHISHREKKLVLESFHKIRHELEGNTDRHSKMLVAGNIELLLNYCIRFYDRQFINREIINKDILTQFESLLNEYFERDTPDRSGLPAVSHFARQLHLSANYFGDLVKKETGKTAMEFIQDKIIALSKDRIFDSHKTISEIAYELGFKYPSHFTRLFKNRVGKSPTEYRQHISSN